MQRKHLPRKERKDYGDPYPIDMPQPGALALAVRGPLPPSLRTRNRFRLTLFQPCRLPAPSHAYFHLPPPALSLHHYRLNGVSRVAMLDYVHLSPTFFRSNISPTHRGRRMFIHSVLSLFSLMPEAAPTCMHVDLGTDTLYA
ncbi:unnamed protein product [Scytosiphon promiscuus]